MAGGNDEEVERWIMRPVGSQPSERRLGIERDDVLGRSGGPQRSAAQVQFNAGRVAWWRIELPNA